MHHGLIYIIILLIFAFSCKQKITNQMENRTVENEEKELANDCLILDTLSIPEKDIIIEYIEQYGKHIKEEGGTFVDVIYEEEELWRIFPVAELWLKNQGFKHISDQEFESKVKMFFDIDISSPHRKLQTRNGYTLYISEIYNEPYGPHFGYTYFVRNRNFIFRPTLNEYFAQVTESHQYYTCFKSSLLHQNKFLFNNSNASLTWLINNDIQFLEMLVKDFGYDKEDKINKAVLDKVNKEYLIKETKNRKALIGLFARKACSGNLRIRENLMKYVSDNYNKQHGTPLDMLNSYASIMVAVNSEEYSMLSEYFTKEERFKLAAYAGYYEQLARYRNNMDGPEQSYYEHNEGWDPGSFLRNELVSNKELLDSIKENNYYNLSGFEDMVSNILGLAERQSEEYARTHPWVTEE